MTSIDFDRFDWSALSPASLRTLREVGALILFGYDVTEIAIFRGCPKKEIDSRLSALRAECRKLFPLEAS